jgi:hypothetical protein
MIGFFFRKVSVDSENDFLRSCRDLDFEWNCRNYAVAVMCKPGPRHQFCFSSPSSPDQDFTQP